MQNTRQRKKRSRVSFESLMAHLGYGVCVLIVWGAVLCGAKLLTNIIFY